MINKTLLYLLSFSLAHILSSMCSQWIPLPVDIVVKVEMGKWPELLAVKSQDEVQPVRISAFMKPTEWKTQYLTAFGFWLYLTCTRLCFLVVKFHHRSVFPVHLNTATVKQWWGTDLIFKIYSRKSDQKKVSSFGLNIIHLIVGLCSTAGKCFMLKCFISANPDNYW